MENLNHHPSNHITKCLIFMGAERFLCTKFAGHGSFHQSPNGQHNFSFQLLSPLRSLWPLAWIQRPLPMLWRFPCLETSPQCLGSTTKAILLVLSICRPYSPISYPHILKTGGPQYRHHHIPPATGSRQSVPFHGKTAGAANVGPNPSWRKPQTSARLQYCQRRNSTLHHSNSRAQPPRCHLTGHQAFRPDFRRMV